MTAMRLAGISLAAVLAASGMVAPMQAQSTAPKVSGVVKSISGTGMTVTVRPLR
jgi:hypothetical protein